MDDERCAALGAATLDVEMGCEHARECVRCGTQVRIDMVEHPFFGFETNCEFAKAQRAKVEA